MTYNAIKGRFTRVAPDKSVEIVHAIRKRTRRELSLIGFSVVDELEALLAA